MKEFIKTNRNGTLFFDKILFEATYPILFTCKNEIGDVFLCVCCQNNEKGCKWLVSKTTPENIVCVLTNKISVRDLLLYHSTDKLSVTMIDRKINYEYDSHDWDEDSVFLPKDTSYLDPDDEEYAEEIKYFNSLNCSYSTAHIISTAISEIDLGMFTEIIMKELIQVEVVKQCDEKTYIKYSEKPNEKRCYEGEIIRGEKLSVDMDISSEGLFSAA